MANKEKIKQEIERRIKNLEFSLENNCVEKHSKLDILGNITTLESLLQFIDSIPEESASEDLDFLVISLEETIGTSPHSREAIKEHLQIAAEWQKKKDQATIELAEDHAMLAGMNKMKEEMMENAVDAFVHQGLYSKYVTECDDEALANALKNYNSGDRVKIIIVKE